MPGAATFAPVNHRSGTEKYSVISTPLSQRARWIRCSAGRRGHPEGFDALAGMAGAVGAEAAVAARRFTDAAG